MRALRLRGAGEVQAVLAYFSAGGARRSKSFTHVFQLYEGFLLRATMRLSGHCISSAGVGAAMIASVSLDASLRPA